MKSNLMELIYNLSGKTTEACSFDNESGPILNKYEKKQKNHLKKQLSEG